MFMMNTSKMAGFWN